MTVRLYEVGGNYEGGVVAASGPRQALTLAQDESRNYGELKVEVIRGRKVTGPSGVIYWWCE